MVEEEKKLVEADCHVKIEVVLNLFASNENHLALNEIDQMELHSLVT